MEKIKQVIKKYWLLGISYLITIILGILNLVDLNISAEVTNALSISFPVSVALSFALNISVGFSFNKTINKLRTDNKSYALTVKKYEIQMQSVSTLNNYYNIDFELPTLAISHVPYTITGSFFPNSGSGDAINYVSPTIVEVDGSTYYCYINKKEVLFSLKKENIIQDYFHDTMQTIQLQNGEGLVDKPRHLLVFKIINASSKPALSMMPRVIIDGGMNKYKGVAPCVMKPNDELLFVVLVEWYGPTENLYSFEFLYNFKGKQYMQKFPLRLKGEEMKYEVLLKEPKELPPSEADK